jgi:hypothetical protein
VKNSKRQVSIGRDGGAGQCFGNDSSLSLHRVYKTTKFFNEINESKALNNEIKMLNNEDRKIEEQKLNFGACFKPPSIMDNPPEK